MKWRNQQEYDNDPDVILQRENDNFDDYSWETMQKALAWWNNLPRINRLKYEYDYTHEVIKPPIYIEFKCDEYKAYTLYVEYIYKE
jgi:hypothetical protein